MNSQKGFTVIEFFVAIFLTVIILGVVYSVYRLQTHTLKVQGKHLDAQQYVRSILSLMIREVRNVGHFPTGACPTPTHTLGIIEADKQAFHFVYDSNEDGDCTDADENIRYGFDTSGCSAGYGNITRQEGSNGAIALSDCNVPTTDGDFFFAYYKKDESTALPYPVGATDLGQIQRLLIKATVESKNTDMEFGGTPTAVMSSNVNLRNRGLAQ